MLNISGVTEKISLTKIISTAEKGTPITQESWVVSQWVQLYWHQIGRADSPSYMRHFGFPPCVDIYLLNTCCVCLFQIVYMEAQSFMQVLNYFQVRSLDHVCFPSYIMCGKEGTHKGESDWRHEVDTGLDHKTGKPMSSIRTNIMC